MILHLHCQIHEMRLFVPAMKARLHLNGGKIRVELRIPWLVNHASRRWHDKLEVSIRPSSLVAFSVAEFCT